MDHSWRPPPPLPPIPGNTTTTTTCPICSISHFPFCPPFIENPRFHHSQSPTDYHHQPPPPRFDHHHHSFPNHHHHQSSLNHNYDFNPSDGYVARRPTTWYGGNPSLDMSPYDGYDNGGIKRMKVEAFDYNNRGIRGPSSIGGGGGEIGDISRVSSDNERILKLIHDHGNAAANAAPKVGADLFSESGGRFAETREVRDDMGLKRKAMSEFRYDQRDELGQFGQSQYDPIESSIPNSLDYGRHSSSQQARVFTNAEQFEQTRDHHRGGGPFHSETLPENYHHLQPITQSNVAIVNKTNLQPNHVNTLSQEGISSSIRHHNSQPSSYSWSESKGHYGHNSFRNNFGPVDVPHAYHGQPPLPASPPPPLPIDPPRNHFFEPLASSPAKKPSLFPISASSSADSSSLRSAVPENQSPAQVYYTNNAGHHASTTLSSAEEYHTRQSSSEKYVRDVQPYPLRHLASEKPNIIDASHIFKLPHRASRPDHLVVILRGLPGSGKSYLAKVLRDIEVDNGGEAPRIHSMDEYFMTEVEKAEDSESSKSSGSLRGKRQVMKTVMEYCYEPEMEEAYRASMLKAFKKTLDEGIYSFIIGMVHLGQKCQTFST